MPPGGIVEAFDVVEDVRACALARGVVRAMTTFRLHHREETLHHRVAPHVARATHATGDAKTLELTPKLFALILTPLIRVMMTRTPN
jgi:hypothetical protein